MLKFLPDFSKLGSTQLAASGKNILTSAIWRANTISLALLAAFAISGPIHVILDATMGIALALSFLLVAGCFIAVSKYKAFPRVVDGWVALSLLVAFTFAFTMLYHAPFRGLVSTGGGDGGNHVHITTVFVQPGSTIYQGFVAFHAVVHWLMVLFGCDFFDGFLLAYYAGLYAVLLSVHLVSAAILQGEEGKENIEPSWFYPILLAVSYYPAQRVFLPVIHYLQSDGFFPHFYGAVWTFFILLFYCLFSLRSVRLLSLLLGVCAIRYVYGLNLADLFVLTGALVFLELRAINKGLVGLVVALGLFGLAALSYSFISEIILLRGGIISTEFEILLLGRLALSLALLVTSFLLSRSPQIESDVLIRLCNFSGLLGVITLVASESFFYITTKPTYYLYKYPLIADLILVASATIVIATFVIKLAKTPVKELAIASGGLLIAIFGGLVLFKDGYFPLRPSYVERTLDTVDTLTITPMYDTEAVNVIHKVLDTNNARFGGFITPVWPVSNFLNASLGFYRELPLYREGLVERKPGYCVFWKSGGSELAEYGSLKRLDKVVKSLIDDPDSRDILYTSKELGKGQKLSYLCPKS